MNLANEVMSEGLNKRCFYQIFNLLDHAATAHQMYTTGSVVGYTLFFRSAFSPASPNFYKESKSVKFGHDFLSRSTTLDIELLSFRKGIRYLKSNFTLLRFDDYS